jgi:hypothetical protein
MHTAKVNTQINFDFGHVHMQGVQIAEQIFDPHRYIQPAATAGTDAGCFAVLTRMNSRQTPTRPYPVLKIQRPHDASHVNPVGTGRIAFRLMAEQAAAGFFFDPYYLLFQNVPPQPEDNIYQDSLQGVFR